MLASSKLQPCLLKQPLETQTKLKELLCIKMQSIYVFLNITRFPDFR